MNLTPSTLNSKGKDFIGTVHHSNWLLFTGIPMNRLTSPRVTAYINIHLSFLCFSLWSDIINHTDILLMSFINDHIHYFIINIYLDSSHSALKYLKDTKVNINNVLVMTGDFDIRDSLWDTSFPHHSSISDDLLIIADSFNLALLSPTNPCPTRYSNTEGESNSTIDLMFLRYGSNNINQYSIHPDWHLTSNYAPLSITISIVDKVVNISKLSIQQNSEQEIAFVEEIISIFQNLDMSNITNKECLENTVNNLDSLVNRAWNKNVKQTRITKHSKQWWTEEYSRSLNNYRTLRSLDNWKKFKKVVKNTKRSFFDTKIQEVVNKSHGPWELMNWINKQKLPAVEAIKYEGQLCLTPKSLWGALHATFNTALHYQVDTDVLNEIGSKTTTTWVPFLKEEFWWALIKCNNSSAPSPDKLMWQHLKTILKQDVCLSHIINITDACINLEHWPSHFKYSSMVIIPKPNKPAYNYLKSFCPIVLLNTIGKLIEKVITERLQFHIVRNNFIHSSQLGSLKFKSTTDAEIALTYVIWSGWVKNKTTSILAFDITQFFPFLNYRLLTLSLEKMGLNPKVTSFFADFLVRRKTNYMWNDFSSPIYEVNVRVGQESALSPILSTLYLSPLLYILEKCLKNLNISVSLISFVDDGLIISQNKLIDISNSQLFYSYNILSRLLIKFGLDIEHSKTETFYFNRSYGTFNPPPLNLSSIGGPILRSKSS